MPGIEVRSELVSCFVIAEFETGYSLLMLQRMPDDKHTPGMAQILYGHIKDGETPESTVLREIMEETGLIVNCLYSLNETFTFYDRIAGCMQLTPVFVAIVDGAKQINVDLKEHTACEWVRIEDAHRRLYWPAQQRAFSGLNNLLLSGGLPELMRLEISKVG